MRLMILILGLFFSNQILAQSGIAAAPNWEHKIHLGYNIGGAAPVPLPDNIRAVKSYSPGFSPSIGYEIARTLNEKWHIGAGLRLDVKGMRISDSVQYLHTLISMDGAAFEGDFTGTNQTVSKNVYISLPAFAVFNAGKGWRVKPGLYGAYLLRPYFRGNVSDGYIRKGNSLGEKVIIENATFNFDDNENKWDWGFYLGGEKALNKYAVSGDLQWGIAPLFPASFRGMGFKMTNIFFTIGVKRQLFTE